MGLSNINHRFVITRGVENTFDFIIKKNNSTLPIEITDTDTVTAYFRRLSDGEVVYSTSLMVEPNLQGKVQLTLSEQDTDEFESLRGKEEDRYYVRPNYSLTLDCSTQANGKFIAKVDFVYVD
jgi:hypothetical protein